jgi:hypothetical protein
MDDKIGNLFFVRFTDIQKPDTNHIESACLAGAAGILVIAFTQPYHPALAANHTAAGQHKFKFQRLINACELPQDQADPDDRDIP